MLLSEFVPVSHVSLRVLPYVHSKEATYIVSSTLLRSSLSCI
jgi:hypothetical protein